MITRQTSNFNIKSVYSATFLKVRSWEGVPRWRCFWGPGACSAAGVPRRSRAPMPRGNRGLDTFPCPDLAGRGLVRQGRGQGTTISGSGRRSQARTCRLDAPKSKLRRPWARLPREGDLGAFDIRPTSRVRIWLGEVSFDRGESKEQLFRGRTEAPGSETPVWASQTQSYVVPWVSLPWEGDLRAFDIWCTCCGWIRLGEVSLDRPLDKARAGL